MTRKKWLGVAAAVALTVAGAGFAVAQAPGPRAAAGDHRAMHARFCADAPARLAGMLAFTEVKIGITAQQKPAWAKFGDDVKLALAPMQKRCEEMTKEQPKDQAAAPADPSAMLAKREQALGARLETVKALRGAYDKLAPSLTAEQKKSLAEMLSRVGHRGPMHAHFRGQIDHGSMGGHMGGPMMGGPMGGPGGGPMMGPGGAPAPKQ